MLAPRRPYHKGNLREKLLREAARMIVRHGLRNLSMRKLGVRVGASRMAAYHHFAGKDELLAAVGQDGFRRLLDRLRAAGGKTAPERLRAALMAYVRFALEEAEFFRLMFTNLLERPLHTEGVEELRPVHFSSFEAFSAFNLLLSGVKECQSAGAFRAADPLLVADTLHAFVHGLARLATDNHLKRPDEVEDLANLGLEVLFCGLAGGALDPSRRPPRSRAAAAGRALKARRAGGASSPGPSPGRWPRGRRRRPVGRSS